MSSRFKVYQYSFLTFALLITPCWAKDQPSAQHVTRGLKVLPQTSQTLSQNPQVIVPISGEYWALIIAINEYKHLPKLKSAVRDAWALRDVLHERYGFEDYRIKMVLDGDATRSNIEGALIQLGQKTKPDDSVLIYFAGHGQYNDDHSLGWWVPVNADPENPGTYILDAVVRNYVGSMRAKHVYLVADSCFSGTLFASNRSLPAMTDKFYSKLQAKRSRWGFTSGSLEPVADQGLNGHSVFAYYFINFLKENTSLYVVPSEIANHVIPLVANNSTQMPRSQPLQGANHEGGQLVFRLTEALVNALEENRRLGFEVAKKEEESQEQLLAKIESLVGAVNQLTLGSQQSALKRQFQEELEKEYQKKFEQQLEKQQHREAQIRSRVQELEAQLAAAQEADTMSSAEESQLRNQLKQQEEHLKQIEQERGDRIALQEQLEDQRKEEAQIRSRLQELEAQLATAQQENILTSSEETRLRNQLQQQEELLKQMEQERRYRLALETQLEEQRQEEAKIRTQLQELEAQLATAQPQTAIMTHTEETRLQDKLQQQEELLKQVEQERESRLALQAQLEEQRESRLALQAQLEDQTRQQLDLQRLLEKELQARLKAETDAAELLQKRKQIKSQSREPEPEEFDFFFGGGF